GVSVGYWGLGLTTADQLDIARRAESLGYDSVWTAEAYGSDAATVLAWLAGQTTRIKLGSGIFQIPGRSAAMTAMTAATIDNLSGGRMLLGLGTSGPQVSEGFHGVRFAKQLQRTREYVAVVRKALAREKVEFHGETIELPLPDGPGKALKLTVRPVQEQIPIFLAVLGPKNVALAGEIADGWLPVFFSPEHTRALRGPLEEGAARAGRSLDGFRICPSVNVMISDDLETARNMMRPILALYVGGMGSREQNFYKRLVEGYGFEEAAQRVQDLYLEGRKTEAMMALPDKLIDLVCIVGPRDRAKAKVRAFADAGVDTLIAWPVMPDQEERRRQLALLAELNE
ncbi:MAG TPA: LLM class F420-dependent oxidoreductase, partial [Candidatus Dormibacteraeota bacterium]|nr:LLM class F420-dependent oxidoreductase [Candidatus Dormibacteraeota bacterium]